MKVLAGIEKFSALPKDADGNHGLGIFPDDEV